MDKRWRLKSTSMLVIIFALLGLIYVYTSIKPRHMLGVKRSETLLNLDQLNALDRAGSVHQLGQAGQSNAADTYNLRNAAANDNTGRLPGSVRKAPNASALYIIERRLQYFNSSNATEKRNVGNLSVDVQKSNKKSKSKVKLDVGKGLKTMSKVDSIHKHFLRLYNKIEKRTLHVTPYRVLTEYPYWEVMHIPVQQIQFVPNFKNPCFFAEEYPGACAHQNSTVQCEDAKLHCLPCFLLAGFAKGGTTDFYSKMTAHQQIKRSTEQELNWWDNKREKNNPNGGLFLYTNMFMRLSLKLITAGTNYYKNYESENTPVISKLISGDFSPTTAKCRGDWEKDSLNWNESAQHVQPRFLMPHKVYHLLPDAKVMFTIRNPTSRAISRFNHKKKDTLNSKLGEDYFHEIIVKCINWMENCTKIYSIERCVLGNEFKEFPLLPNDHLAYLRAGIYSVFIKQWIKVFPKQNLLFMKFEDYVKSPVDHLEAHVLPFLGLDPYETEISNELRNTTQKNSARLGFHMRNDTIAMLDAFYAPFNRELASLLGERFSWP